MTPWTCRTCAVQYPATATPPAYCPICTDERQWVPEEGQQWTTVAELARTHRSDVREVEPGLLGIGLEPEVAIGQRALLVCTPAGNVLWDCVPMLDDAARDRIASVGGIDAICVSHPHFYASMVDLAEEYDAPIHLPVADRAWVPRTSERIVWFEDQVTPLEGVTVRRLGGHFEGASVLHWADGAGGAGALLTGDTITVVADRGWVSFMWSYPNLLPLDAPTVETIAARVADLDFDRIHGGWWDKVVARDAAAVVQRSARRYVDRLAGHRP